jgi:hypothetical protein
MIGNALADTLLPLFRRPMEDVVYETLDRRDVATRPEMRDYVDASVEPGSRSASTSSKRRCRRSRPASRPRRQAQEATKKRGR